MGLINFMRLLIESKQSREIIQWNPKRAESRASGQLDFIPIPPHIHPPPVRTEEAPSGERRNVFKYLVALDSTHWMAENLHEHNIVEYWRILTLRCFLITIFELWHQWWKSRSQISLFSSVSEVQTGGASGDRCPYSGYDWRQRGQIVIFQKIWALGAA